MIFSVILGDKNPPSSDGFYAWSLNSFKMFERSFAASLLRMTGTDLLYAFFRRFAPRDDRKHTCFGYCSFTFMTLQFCH